MKILEEIINKKKQEVEALKTARSFSSLEREIMDLTSAAPNKFPFTGSSTGIIAEFKRRSPSLGWINENADVGLITKGYADHGAAAISVLTDETFFGGSTNDLELAKHAGIPILRKDFIIDPYQVLETKLMGADIILLIAACLSPGQVKELSLLAHAVGLQVLLEIHEEAELDHILGHIDIVGINNRDLRSFEVSLDTSLRLVEKIDEDFLKISESGIRTASHVHELRSHGFDGFLIGEAFMKMADPVKAFQQFTHEIAAHED